MAKKYNQEYLAHRIIAESAVMWGVGFKDVVGPSRDMDVVRARHIAVYLMRKHVGLSFPVIGKILGGRHHTTAMHAYTKTADEILSNSFIKESVERVYRKAYAE